MAKESTKMGASGLNFDTGFVLRIVSDVARATKQKSEDEKQIFRLRWAQKMRPLCSE
jgi:hypothetical protein